MDLGLDELENNWSFLTQIFLKLQWRILKSLENPKEMLVLHGPTVIFTLHRLLLGLYKLYDDNDNGNVDRMNTKRRKYQE